MTCVSLRALLWVNHTPRLEKFGLFLQFQIHQYLGTMRQAPTSSGRVHAWKVGRLCEQRAAAHANYYTKFDSPKAPRLTLTGS